MSDAPKPVYNNKRFRVVDYNFDTFVGPQAGDKYIDATFTDLATGSSTCSMYTKNIKIYRDIVEKFSDVNFVMVYVREAHPGERMGPHQTMDDKFKSAELVAPRYKEFRRVLVDSLDGDFHRAYGAMPNVVYIIRPDGTIHYRCNWAAPHLIEATLEDRESYHKVENAPTAELRATRSMPHMMRTMWTGGVVALYDFFKAAPLTVAKHVQVDAYYEKHGRFRNQPLSQEEIANRQEAAE
jgi:hypothetical protein